MNKKFLTICFAILFTVSSMPILTSAESNVENESIETSFSIAREILKSYYENIDLSSPHKDRLIVTIDKLDS